MSHRSAAATLSVLGSILVLAATPAAAAMTERQYLSYVGDEASMLGQAAATASTIVQAWTNGQLSDSQAKAELAPEQTTMQSVYNSLSVTSPPCSAYVTVDAELTSAAWDFQQSVYYEIQGIGTTGTNLMATGSDYANQATVHMQNFQDAQRSVQYPACPSGATSGSGGTGGVGSSGGVDPIVYGLLAVLVVGVSVGAGVAFLAYRRQKRQQTERP